MDNSQKFLLAVRKLKANVEFITHGDITSQTEFNNVNWVTGTEENGSAITSNTCPHAEITWSKVKAEMDKL